jgi:hypothetical protein
MKKTMEYRAALVLAAALSGAAMLSGCATKIYEGEQPAHNWNDREDPAYRRYLADRQLEYREYSGLSTQQQRDYWEWRDHHPD